MDRPLAPNPGSHPMRPLLPRPPVASGTGPDGYTSDSPSIPRRHPVVVACESCRKKRTKCSGDRPVCAKCAESATVCVYATASNETRHRALKRRFAELRERSDADGELINLLRTRPYEDVNVFIQRLRAGEDVDGIVRLVKDGDLLLQYTLKPAVQTRYEFPVVSTMPDFLDAPDNPYLRSLLYRRTFVDQPHPGAPSYILPVHDKKYDAPYHAAQLVEPLLENFHISQWSSVSISDELARALLSAYFYYEYPFNCFFHKDSFLKDLAKGRKRYCSSLLLNAIFASACHCLPSSSSYRSDFWLPQSLVYQFLAESKRLWEREHSRNHITTVQAGIIISVACNMDGTDKVGSTYLGQSITMAHEMGLFSASLEDEGTKKKAVYSTTAWGLFSWATMQSFHFYQAPIVVDPPHFPLPSVSEIQDVFGELWVKYPDATRHTPLHHSLVFCAVGQFRAIMNEIGVRCHGAGKLAGPVRFPEAFLYRQRLLSWYETLPEPLKPERIVFPAQLKVHLHYFNLLINLFNPLTAKSGKSGRSESNSDNFAAALDIVGSSRVHMESILRLYYARHGFERCDTLIMTSLHFVGFGALNDLAQAEGPRRTSLLSTIVLCAKGLRDQAHSYYIAEAIFALFRDSMAPDDVRLLRDFAYFEDEEGRKRLIGEHIQSTYPINIVSISEDPEKQRLDILVRSYMDLEIDDGESSVSDQSTR